MKEKRHHKSQKNYMLHLKSSVERCSTDVKAQQFIEDRAPPHAYERGSSKKKEFLENKIQIINNLGPDDIILIQDESYFYFSCIPNEVWAIRGSKPTLPIYGSIARLNVIGAIDPINDKGYFAYIKNLNAKLFESFLRGLLKFYPNPGKTYVILDNASPHHAESLKPFKERLRQADYKL